MGQSNGKNKRLLLLIDWIVKNDDWSFLRELRALGHECETVGVAITREYGSRFKKIVYLWFGYFFIGLKGFINRKGFDVIIAYQGVAGLFYSFFKMLFFQKEPRLVLMGFFFKKRKNRFYNQLRYYFTRLALTGVDKVVCYSSKEADYYNSLFKCKQRKFEFVPFGVNIARLETLLARNVDATDYIFSAGSSNRDYGTFFKAVENLDVRVVVFAKKFNVAGTKIPANVEMMYDVYGTEFENSLLGARFVVIPLEDPELSSGQMVLLEAMALGKAVIVSRAWGTIDYVHHDSDALLVDVRDEKTMKKAIANLLQSDKKVDELGQKAKDCVLHNFTVSQMACAVSNILN